QRGRGRVARLVAVGACVDLAAGIDGLVHVSEIAPQRTERVKDVLTVGQEVEAMVQSVDPAKRRISLSIKATNPDYVAEPAPKSAPRPRAKPTPQPPRPATPAPEAPRELTTMAIALREAQERARKKAEGR